MGKYIPLILVAVLIVGHYILSKVMQKKLADDLARLMVSKDHEQYQKLLYSKKVMFFLNPNVVCLYRASDQMTQGHLDEAKKYLGMVQLKRANAEQLMTAYQMKSMIAMNQKDKEAYLKIAEDLKAVRNEKNAPVIDSCLKENAINTYLYFDYDPKVISMISKELEKCEGPAKGRLQMLLAKAYRLNQQDKEAMKALEKAKQLLKGTEMEPLIKSALQDLTILDNE